VNDIDSRRAARCIVNALKHSSSIVSVATAGGH
jgi:hypothetical protein